MVSPHIEYSSALYTGLLGTLEMTVYTEADRRSLQHRVIDTSVLYFDE